MRPKNMEHEIKHALHSPWFRHVALIMIGLVGLVVAVFAYFRLATPPLPTTLTAHLTNVEGHVEIGRNGSWQSANENLRLEENDQLRVVGDGRAVIALKDGSEIRLDKNTHIVLSNLSIRDFRLFHEGGRVYARIIPSPARSVTVLTDTVAYEALGTAFLVTNTSGSEGVEVYQSAVDARLGNNDFVRVGQGKSYFIRGNEDTTVNEITVLDIGSVKDDNFMVWNAQLDKENTAKILRLGLIEEIH